MTGTRWWRKVCPRSKNKGNIQKLGYTLESLLISMGGTWQMRKKSSSYPNPITFIQSLHQVPNIYFDMVRNYQNYSAEISRYTSDSYLACLILTLYFTHVGCNHALGACPRIGILFKIEKFLKNTHSHIDGIGVFAYLRALFFGNSEEFEQVSVDSERAFSDRLLSSI